MSATGAWFLDLCETPEAEQGAAAYQRGAPRSANPHRVGAQAFTAWQLGWDNQQDADAPRCEP